MLEKLLIFKKIVILLIIPLFLQSCGGFLKPDWSKPAEPSGKKRARQNVIEGKGFSTGLFKSKENTNFTFASSNPLWRASLEIIDFMPLNTVDYSGGIIITDWFNGGNDSNRDLKITIRFLSNEIRSDALKIIVHERICANNNCTTSVIDSKISGEIQLAILKKATLMEKKQIEKLIKERRKKDPRGGDNAIPQDQL